MMGAKMPKGRESCLAMNLGGIGVFHVRRDCVPNHTWGGTKGSLWTLQS